MTTEIEIPTAKNYPNASVAHFGPLEKWKETRVPLKQTGDVYPGKTWIKDLLGLTGLELSLSSMPAGASVPYEHIHDQNEELYLFLSGKGQMKLDNKIIDVEAGSVVRVDPAAVRCWRNTGTADLVHIVIQAKAGSLMQWTAEDGTITSQEPNWE
ncbi:MAG TPA: cupin domain-containing protein [Opitutae bacterium]|nr:cupin domain-containing protein [Opitutae bacterium]